MKLIQWVFLVVIAAIFNRELEALAVPPAHSYPSASSKFMPEFEKEFRQLQEHVEKLDEKHRKLNKSFDKLNEDHYKLRKEFKSKMSYLRSANIAESYLEYFKNFIRLLKPILRFLQRFVARPDAKLDVVAKLV